MGTHLQPSAASIVNPSTPVSAPDWVLEQALHRKNEQIDLLASIAAHVLANDDPDHLVRDLFDKVAAQLDLDVYFNFMVDETGEGLRLDSCAGIPEALRPQLMGLKFGQAVCGTVAQNKCAIISHHVQQSDDPKTELIRSLGIRAYACNPLMAGDRVIGTLSFGSRSRDHFTDDELHMLRSMCHFVAIAKERLRTESELREALERSEAASIAKSEFLANMSHEIRTPMNAVVGLANLLQDEELPSQKRQEFLRTLQLSSQHLLQLINDLLDISKLETHQVELEKTPFSMQDLLSEIITIQTVRAKEKDIDLILYQPQLEHHLFLGDPVRIRQILTNLVGNAIKFTESGHVMISTHYRPTENGMTLELRVTDTGIGIAPEHMPMIFEKFTQADSSISRKYGGTGLGLSITKTLVELMGGRISVESALGRGSSFCIELPLQLQEKRHHVTDDTPVSRSDTTPTSHHVRVLLVEDYWANVLVATAILDNLGYQYEVAENGLEAVRKFGDAHFDAVLMDVQMPEMDGIVATQTIRSQEEKTQRGHIPIIGMTAHAMKGDRERCLAAGMDDYISKPFQPIELETKLRDYCQLKEVA